MRTRMFLAIVMMALTLSANAQELIYANRESVEDKAAMALMIRDFKAQTAGAQVPVRPAEPNPCPSPTEPCPQPTPAAPGITVTGVIVDDQENAVTDAYVLVSFLNSSGSREHYPPVRTDTTGTFVVRNEFTEPPMGTEMLVQSTAYAQTPWEGQYKVTSTTVEVTGILNDAGRIVVVRQMAGIRIEAKAEGNVVKVRVRHGKSFPRRAVSLVQVSVPGRTAFSLIQVGVQKPYIRGPLVLGGSGEPPWMEFYIPEKSPKGGGGCGNAQVTSLEDPSDVLSSEHGFCFRYGVVGTW